ncbi:hypothetical protein F4774DRAFT_413732 [Daldinia eschscholtzii]|nr:hypothetical protein F4774DRAFT_413732 [Daldinia eschscholtzii]
MGSNIIGVYSSRELNSHTNGSVASDTQPVERRSDRPPSRETKTKSKKTGAGVQKSRNKTRGKGRKGEKGKQRKEN